MEQTNYTKAIKTLLDEYHSGRLSIAELNQKVSTLDKQLTAPMTAHYFASRTNKVLIVSTTYQPIGITIQVTGKKDARNLARSFNAQPWNF